MTDYEFHKLIKPDAYQVFVFSSPCGFPISFARHSWFVVNMKGTIHRWEVIRKKNLSQESWGYVYKNFLSPTAGMKKFRTQKSKHFSGRLEKVLEGDDTSKVKDLVDFIENSCNTYPDRNIYHMFTGPNSNGYTAWVIKHFPTLNIKLPWNCYGKGFKQK